MLLDLDAISVVDRIREDMGDSEIEELMKSLVALGQLQPIVVKELDEDGKYELIAGERRMHALKKLKEKGQACKDVPLGQVKAEIRGHLPPYLQLQMEFDENMKRKDFSFVEKARFITRYHEMMKHEASKVGEKWPMELTAVALRLSIGSISNYLRIEEAVKTDPTVAKAATINAAVKRLKVVEQMKARQIEANDNASEAQTEANRILLLGDACELIKSVPDESIDFINFDPPWGDNTNRKSNENWEPLDAGFDDDTETSDNIINTMLPELLRVLKTNRMMVYWYRTWAYNDMCERLEKAGFSLKFGRTPCIWYKPDKVSDQNRYPEKMLIDAYETFLIVRKGPDAIYYERNWQNVFVHNRVPRATTIHPTEKPISLCQDLLKLCSTMGETVLDPTAGSCAFLHAALLMDRKPLGFELTETIHQRGTLRLTDYLRTVKRV